VSVERFANPSGDLVWRVRWREAGRNRSKVLGRRADAIAFDAEIRRRKRTGELGLMEASRQTLDAFAAEWLEVYARPNLAASTLATYAIVWDKHISPRLGGYELRELSLDVCQRFAAELAAAGVGPGARRKALVLLGGVLQRAVEWGRLAANPVRVVHKPPGRRARAVRPFAPATVEAMRGHLLLRGRLREATLVSVLAYTGARPGEALALRWADVGTRTLLVERAVSDGMMKVTKTGQTRSVRLLGPVRADLTEWRRASEARSDSALIFPAADGRPWRRTAWQNWRRRVFTPAAEATGITGARPYDLRHSAASLWLHEGRTIVEVAAWMGHSGQMALSTYLHVMSDLGDDRVSAEEAIRQARTEDRVPISYLSPRAESVA
jgi:integrase